MPWLFSGIASSAFGVGAGKTSPLPPCCHTQAPVAPAAVAAPGLAARLRRRLRRLLARMPHADAPWVLLAGAPGAGKTSLALSALATTERDMDDRATPAFDGAACHRFPHGLLIDADGKLDAAGWTRLLDQIEARRPARPLDGLLLALPARLLMESESATVIAAAAALRRRLHELQQRHRWVLPVYIVVTACDQAGDGQGYRGATAAIPVREMIGWSAPEVGDYAGAQRWSASAFDQLARRFHQCQLQAAHDPALPPDDAAFLYPHQLQGLRGALEAWLQAVFEPSAPQPGLMLRGIYFSGAAGAAPAKPADPRADVGAVADLVTAKVLAERNLAYPARGSHSGRPGRALRLLLWSLALLAAVLAGQLALRTAELRSEAVQLERSLQAIAADVALPATTTCLEQSRVVGLIDMIVRTPVLDYAPWSLLDRRLREHGARRIAAGALDQVILPALACRLAERAAALRQPDPQQLDRQLAPASFMTAAQGNLLAYLDQVLALEHDYARLRRLGAPNGAADPGQAAQALQALLHSLYDGDDRSVSAGRSYVRDSMLTTALTYVSLPLTDLPPRDALQAHMQHLQSSLPDYLSEQLGGGAAELERLGAATDTPWPSDLLDRARRGHAWLNWVQNTLMPSSVAHNPCQEIASGLAPRQAALAAYGYVLQAPVGQPFSPEACYRDLMQTLDRQSLSRYGRVVDDNGGSGPRRLNPALVAELTGLAALVTQDFMQLAPVRPFQCLWQDGAWQPDALQRARDFARDYQLFARQQGVDGKSRPPLFDGVARRQLEMVMNETLDAAQAPATPGRDPAGADARLARQGANFAAAQASMSGVIDLYRQMGMAGSGADLLGCVSGQAADALAQTGELAERSRLYMSQAASAGGAPFDLGGAGSLADYLASQIARVQVLAGYAAPYLQLLQAQVPPDQARRSASQKAAYWNNTVKELAQYQAHDNSGEAGKLHSLIARQVADNDAGPCAATPSAAPDNGGNDLFSARRRALQRQLAARCDTRAQAQWLKDYGALADAFNMRLAGRYPFAALAADDLPRAELKQFFSDYGALLASVRADSDKRAGAAPDQACKDVQCDFLHQFDDLRKALAPVLQSGAPLRLAVTFNARPRDAAGADQIVVWSLSSGTATIGPPNRQPGALDWPPGEALSFDLAWADRSPWRPVAERQQRDLVISGASAQFGYSGEWGLLRMIERHRLPTAGDGQPMTLEFQVPLAPPATPAMSPASARARLYLSLALSTVDSKSKVETTLRLPYSFPHFAPR